MTFRCLTKIDLIIPPGGDFRRLHGFTALKDTTAAIFRSFTGLSQLKIMSWWQHLAATFPHGSVQVIFDLKKGMAGVKFWSIWPISIHICVCPTLSSRDPFIIPVPSSLVAWFRLGFVDLHELNPYEFHAIPESDSSRFRHHLSCVWNPCETKSEAKERQGIGHGVRFCWIQPTGKRKNGMGNDGNIYRGPSDTLRLSIHKYTVLYLLCGKMQKARAIFHQDGAPPMVAGDKMLWDVPQFSPLHQHESTSKVYPLQTRNRHFSVENTFNMIKSKSIINHHSCW